MSTLTSVFWWRGWRYWRQNSTVEGENCRASSRSSKKVAKTSQNCENANRAWTPNCCGMSSATWRKFVEFRRSWMIRRKMSWQNWPKKIWYLPISIIFYVGQNRLLFGLFDLFKLLNLWLRVLAPFLIRNLDEIYVYSLNIHKNYLRN